MSKKEPKTQELNTQEPKTKEPKEKKPKKKNHHFLFQTGLFVLLMLLIVIIILTLVLILNTVTSFALVINENQKAFASYATTEMADFKCISWLIDYWVNNPENISTTDEIPASESTGILAKLGRSDSRDITNEEAASLTATEQRTFANFCYEELAWVFGNMTKQLPVDQLMCYVPDLDDDSNGTILFDGILLEQGIATGPRRTTVTISEGDQNAFTIDSIAFSKKDDSDDSSDEGDNIIGEWIDLKTERKVGIGAGIKKDLLKELFNHSGNFIGIGILVMVIFTGAILIFLYFIVSKPLSKIKKAMIHYQESKNTKGAVVELGKIRSRNEIGLLADNLSAFSVEMDRYTREMGRLAVEREHAKTELNVATSIQSDMLPSVFPPFPNRTEFDIYATMEPAQGVAGDFYDFYFLDDDHLVLTIADVSGKSIPAALFMAISKTTLKNRAVTGGGTPAEILEDTNNQLCEGNKSNFFVTVWLGILTVSTGDLFAANAGHEYPGMRLGDSEYQLIRKKHGPMLGAVEGVVYHNEHYKLSPGDALFLYTDGVTEASAADQSMFTEKRLEEVLASTKREDTAEEILSTVRKAIEDFVGDAPQFDDLTMLSFVYHGK